MPRKRTKIREARTTEEFSAAVVERWHEVYRAAPPSPPAEEAERQRALTERGRSRPLGEPARRPLGGRFLGQRPMDDDDFD